MIRVCRTEKYGEDAPETADLYFSYGKALLENAISQASVLGKQGEEEQEEKVDTKGVSTLFDNPEHLLIDMYLQAPVQVEVVLFFLSRAMQRM